MGFGEQPDRGRAETEESWGQVVIPMSLALGT